MHGANHPIPLTRRLVGRYLAFALAGLLICLVTTLSLAFRGSLTSLIPMAAAGPGILLAFGGLVLHQTVRQSSMIEEELNRVATDPHNLSKVHQLPGNDPSVVGWNALIDRLLSLQSLTDVEQRIVSATQGRKDERLLNVLNSISDGIAVTEKDGAIVFANETILAFLQGNSVDMVLGHNLLQQLDVQRAHNASEVQRAAKQPTGAVVVEIRRSANVQEGVLRLSRNPVQGDSLGRFVWMVRDVTQQALVNVARNEFVSTATHELRTPLANIKAYAETLAIHDGIDVEQQKEFCNIINAEATRLSRFVDEVLNVNQMEAGSLADAVRNALALDARNRQVRLLRAQILARMGELTEREAQVMAFVVRGHTSKEIAQTLCISPRTVEVHRKNLFSKMRAASLAGLVEQVIQVREMPDAAGRARSAVSGQLRDSTYLTRAGNV